MKDPDKLPAEVEASIREQLRSGISLSCRWRLPTSDPRYLEVAAIHWRPGDPSALAKAILEHVHDQPVPLSIDGHNFIITRQDWPPGWDQDT
jgi:hypothetical protein